MESATASSVPRSDRVLLHQVHPVKLAADISASLISNVLLWNHAAIAGIAIRLALPLAGSAITLRYGDVERLRSTPAGRYVLEHMPSSATAVRLAGDVLMALGCWFRRPAVIVIGAAVIGAGWSHGLVRPPRAR
jgi:hypothetical protein